MKPLNRNSIFLCLLIQTGLAAGAVLYVDPAGPADPNGSALFPFSTILAALQASRSGDTILLNPGTYTGPGNYNLDPNGRILTIQSINPDDFDSVTQTIIDPNYAGRGFLFHNHEDPNFVLSGLTIRRTWCDQDDNPPHGSAVHCSGASPTIRFCIFENCDADGEWGGVFYGESCNSRIEHCLLNGNKARYGGGLAINLGSRIRLEHCTIAGNQALFNGGGIFCDFNSAAILSNSIVYFNRLADLQNPGRQISLRDSSLNASYSAISNSSKDLEIKYESTLTYGDGVIHTDPNFALYHENLPPSACDFHLASPAGRWDSGSKTWVHDPAQSPCIDAGDPNLIWTGEPWPNGKRINMGCYGGTPQASMNGNAGDFNLSGEVDMEDFAELADLWLNEVSLDFHDLCGNGRIDLEDFERFSREWLWSKN